MIKSPFFLEVKSSIEQYLSITKLEQLTVLIDSQETCGLLIADEEPSDGNLNDYLPEECCHGYVIVKNNLFYIDKDNQVCKQILVNDANIIQKIKKRVCYENEDHCLLLPSQLAELKKLTGHSPKQQFCRIKLEDDAIHYQFYRNKWQKIDENENIHPIIKNLYPALVKFNEKHSRHDNVWQRVSHFFKPSKKPIADPECHEEVMFPLPSKTLTEWLWLPFVWVNKALKFILAPIFLNNFIIQQTVGRIIAAIANYGNPHYQTEPETVGNILGPIIFPGGFKKPQVFDNGQIILDPILSRQYHALYHFEESRDRERKEIVHKNQRYNEFSFAMPDGYHNDGIEGANALAMQKLDTGEPNKVLHLIWFNGNGGCYQNNLGEMTCYLTALQEKQIPAKIVCFNYPGVLSLDNPPKNGQLLIDYGIAQVERLKSMGISTDNIVLHGTSLGGCIASNVMAFYHNRGETLGGLNISRTFSSTTNVGLSYVKKTPYIGKLLAILLRPILAFGLWGTSWNLDTAKAFCSIPAPNKYYATALTPRKIKNAYEKANMPILDDDVLEDDASLHRSWRLKTYRWLSKKFGLFGIDKEHYREMNAHSKLVPTILPIDKGIDDSQSVAGTLSHIHCAHADIDSSLRRVTTNHGFQLLVREPTNAPISGMKVHTKAKYVANDKPVHIPVSQHSLFSMNLEFMKDRAMKNGVMDKNTSIFDGFFKQDKKHSGYNEAASSAVNFIMSLIP